MNRAQKESMFDIALTKYLFRANVGRNKSALLPLCTDRATAAISPEKLSSHIPLYTMKPRIQGSDSARLRSWLMFVGWIIDDHFLGMLRPLRKLELRFLHGAPIHELF